MANGVAQISTIGHDSGAPGHRQQLAAADEGIVAVFLVGGLGVIPIAAVGLGQLLAFIATTLVSGLSVGTNVIIAQQWGARPLCGGRQSCSALSWASYRSPLAWRYSDSQRTDSSWRCSARRPEVIALALPYSTLIFLVIPFTVLSQVLSFILQGTGDTKTPMYAMIVVNILHIAIAYPLIYGQWGFPAVGVKGAAVAVGIAEAAGSPFCLLVAGRFSDLRNGSTRPDSRHLAGGGSGLRGANRATSRNSAATLKSSWSTARYPMRPIKWAYRLNRFRSCPVMASPSPPRPWWVKVSARGNILGPNSKTGKRTGWPPLSCRRWACVFLFSLRPAPRLHQR